MLVGASLGPAAPRGSLHLLSVNRKLVTRSDLHVSELCVQWRGLMAGRGEAERAVSKSMDKSQGKRLAPKCCPGDNWWQPNRERILPPLLGKTEGKRR